jgi:hypothetical protein
MIYKLELNMNTFTNGLHPRNKLILFLGKNEQEYFNIDLGEELQDKIVKYFKSGAKKTIHQQCKYYYYDDLKYIITSNGIHKCMKNKIHKYSCSDNAMICSLQEINIPIDIFPPITSYHGTRIIERSIFQHRNFTVEAMNVVYNNGNITHECLINIYNYEDEVLQSFLREYKFDLNFNNHHVISHGDNNVLSII